MYIVWPLKPNVATDSQSFIIIIIFFNAHAYTLQIAQKSTFLSIVHFVHEELNLMWHGHPVQPVKINMIQAMDISRDVAVMVYDQIPKYAQNVHRGVVPNCLSWTFINWLIVLPVCRIFQIVIKSS